MLVSSSTNGAEEAQQKPLLQWPIFTRNSLAGFECKLTPCSRAMRLSTITIEGRSVNHKVLEDG
jgi:hypothetical protein